jgi:anaerobic selenocysteine-containing dehydrogenase
MVWNMNPVIALPDTTRVTEGFRRDDLFTVVVEHFLTDTARYADIVLPSTTQLEHFDILGAWGHHYISVNNPAIAPREETKSHGEVMRLLAAAMNLDHPALQVSDEQIAAAALPETVDLAQLKAAGWHKTSPSPVAVPTPDAKLRLTGPNHEVRRPPEPDMLQMLTPKGHFFMNTSFANMSRHRTAMKNPTLQMNPTDAATRNLTDGQQVAISNEQGAIVSALEVSDTVSPGVIALAGKWWTSPPETAAVANVLTPAVWSPGGQPAYNEIYVHVTSADTAMNATLGAFPNNP